MWQRVVLYGMMALKYTTMLNRKAWQAQAFERLHNIKIASAATNYDWRVHFPPKKGQQSRYPPALLCEICGNLMALASMTPYC